MVDQVKRAGSRDKANDLATALVVLLYQRQNSEVGGTCRGDRGTNQSGVEGRCGGPVKLSTPFPMCENHTPNKIAQLFFL